MNAILSVAAVIGFGLIIGRALKTGEIRKAGGRIRRDEYPLTFYFVLLIIAGACLGAVSIFSGLLMKIIQWSI